MKNDRLIKKLLNEGYFKVYPFEGIVTNKKDKILGKCKNTYPRVTYKYKNKSRSLAIHRIIWIYMYGLPAYGTIINHKDTDKTNSKIHNLEKTTPAENTRHAYANGCCTTSTNHAHRSSKGKFCTVGV